ncbi:MAG TPA: trypsin-like peptidase domain-containing protein [Methylomirabilota bacterium]|nr:trypsin-like peptidase domain-containing protein [Methylomirabilota bacterium]
MPCLRLIVGIVLLAVLAGGAGAEEAKKLPPTMWREAPQAEGDSELDRLSRAFVRLADGARPAIVQIRVADSVPSNPKGDGPQPQGSRGTGFVIHPQGYILTAHHVVENAKDIEIRFADMHRLAAKIVAADAQVDVALLKVQTDRELPVLSLGDSDKIRVGELTIVFGYPFGRESSMSLGIVSRPGRTYHDSAGYEFIQTDAGAYPGGSGGPLLNSKGHVIGMITMASEKGTMGFATPINVVKRVIPRLLNGEKFVWGWLGVRMAELSLEMGKSLGLSPVRGVLVSAVSQGQPAERGGIRKQDIILSVNDAQVDSPRDVLRMIGGLEAGKIVKLTIIRNGKTMQLSVPLGTKPE